MSMTIWGLTRDFRTDTHVVYAQVSIEEYCL